MLQQISASCARVFVPLILCFSAGVTEKSWRLQKPIIEDNGAQKKAHRIADSPLLLGDCDRQFVLSKTESRNPS